LGLRPDAQVALLLKISQRAVKPRRKTKENGGFALLFGRPVF
jgi:hypothetical protein